MPRTLLRDGQDRAAACFIVQAREKFVDGMALLVGVGPEDLGVLLGGEDDEEEIGDQHSRAAFFLSAVLTR